MNLLKNCFLLLALFLLIANYGCRKDLPPIESYYEYIDIHDYAVDSLGFERYDTIPGGIYLRITKEGAGPVPKTNDKLYTYYRGTLLTGKEFGSRKMYVAASDGSDSIQTPMSFTLGTSSMIAGWDSAFYRLNRGSEAIVVIPSNMAYGAQNQSGIPPNSPLRYDVELLWLKGDPGTEDEVLKMVNAMWAEECKE
ncbi:MAG: FKBP-type peptidyl-prolyl cis-trans isomerase [Cytophagaceae bacterium]|jgi:hypothetical protein|nr:FKBP-type peptidyl-prolyl cis-trans isomerase [Cytophagaceae bacterium]